MKTLGVLVACGLLLGWVSVGHSQESKSTPSFKVEYSKKHALKESPPLENATIKVKFYRNGTPVKITEIKTDGDKKFHVQKKLGKHFAIEVLSVKGQKKFKQRCHGYKTPMSNTLSITCRQRG